MLEEPAATTHPREAGQNTGIGCCVDHPIAAGQTSDVAGRPKVPMNEFHTQPLNPHPIRFRPRTQQIVHAYQADAFEPFEQAFSKDASHEATYSGNKNLHATMADKRCFQLAAISLKIIGSVLTIFQ